MAEPYATVAPDESGSTTAQIQTADGKLTMVTVRPDGTIVRDQTYTDDQGRKVTVRFDSGDGSKQETVVDLKNGAKFVTTTATNGEKTVEEHVVYDDGSVDIDTTFPDGSTKGEHIANLPNGGERHTISYGNGDTETRTITKDATGNSHEVHVDTSGGTTTVDTMPGPNGLVHQITVTPGGERIDQSTQDYTDADGNTVHVESGAWGSTTGIRHPDGSTDERTELADGATLTKSWTQYPDGTTERVETDAEGVSNTVLQTKNPDGSFTTKATDIDGRVVEHVVQTDGTVRSTIREPGDGGVTRSVTMADGRGETSFEEPGQEPHVVTNDPVLPQPVTDATDATGSAMPSLDDTPAAAPVPATAAGPAPHDDGPVLHDAFADDDPPPAAGTTGAAAPTGQMTTDSFGQTKVEVPATDGLVTTILVANDGATTRMQSWDDATTGAHVTHYAYPNGTSAEERTHTDGSTSRATSDERGNAVQLDTQRIDQDGNVVKETQFADGRPSEVTTTSTTYEIDDGSTVEKTQAADNSVTTKTTFRDGHSEQITQHPDGTTERATSEVQPDGTQVDRVTDASGAETVTLTTHEPQGLIRAVTTHPDGTTEERVDQNYVNDSGDVVEVHQADGQRVESVTRRDGSIDTHTVHSDGTTEQTSFNTFPNGVSVRNTTLGDGRTQSVTQTKSADGSVITQKIDFDGTKHDHTVHLDGSSVSETTQTDGTQEKITSQPNGAATVQYQAPGEEEHVVLRGPDLPYPLDGRTAEPVNTDPPMGATGLDAPVDPDVPHDMSLDPLSSSDAPDAPVVGTGAGDDPIQGGDPLGAVGAVSDTAPDATGNGGTGDDAVSAPAADPTTDPVGGGQVNDPVVAMGQVDDPTNSGDPTGAADAVSDATPDDAALPDVFGSGAQDVLSAGAGDLAATPDTVGDVTAGKGAEGPKAFSVDDLDNSPDPAPDPDITGAGTVRAGVPGASQAAAGTPAEGPKAFSADDLNEPGDAPPADDVLGTGSAGAMAADTGASQAAAGSGAQGPGGVDDQSEPGSTNAFDGTVAADAPVDTAVAPDMPDVTAAPPPDDFAPPPVDDAPATEDDSAFSDM